MRRSPSVWGSLDFTTYSITFSEMLRKTKGRSSTTCRSLFPPPLESKSSKSFHANEILAITTPAKASFNFERHTVILLSDLSSARVTIPLSALGAPLRKENIERSADFRSFVLSLYLSCRASRLTPQLSQGFLVFGELLTLGNVLTTSSSFVSEAVFSCIAEEEPCSCIIARCHMNSLALKIKYRPTGRVVKS